MAPGEANSLTWWLWWMRGAWFWQALLPDALWGTGKRPQMNIPALFVCECTGMCVCASGSWLFHYLFFFFALSASINASETVNEIGFFWLARACEYDLWVCEFSGLLCWLGKTCSGVCYLPFFCSSTNTSEDDKKYLCYYNSRNYRNKQTRCRRMNTWKTKTICTNMFPLMPSCLVASSLTFCLYGWHER